MRIVLRIKPDVVKTLPTLFQFIRIGVSAAFIQGLHEFDLHAAKIKACPLDRALYTATPINASRVIIRFACLYGETSN